MKPMKIVAIQARRGEPYVKYLTAKDQTNIAISYDVEDYRSNRPAVFAKNFYVTVTGKNLKPSSKVEVILDYYSWDPWNHFSEQLRAKLVCEGVEKTRCLGKIYGEFSVVAYGRQIQHEATILIDGQDVINPMPMPHNPSGEKFHLILATYPNISIF